METKPPWFDVFEVVDPDGQRTESQGLPLRQMTANGFQVGATIRYLGDTGLDPGLDDCTRALPLDLDRRSDLASVPAMLGWFERPHGVHTPAALFHDNLLVTGQVPPEQADLLFRFMLKDLGVPPIKRNLMWTAVALRTRWVTKRVSLVVWTLLSITGLTSFVLAAAGVDFPSWTGGRDIVFVVTALAPLPASLLWGKERRAALVAALMAIWILPAAAIALVAIVVYRTLEWAAETFRSASQGAEEGRSTAQGHLGR